MGVEASAEIQSAARKVLEENRRLRAMLRTRGVPEAEIAAALGINDKTLEQGSSAPVLMTMLDRRWAYNTQGQSHEDSYLDHPSETGSVIDQAPSSDLTPLAIPPQSAISRTTTDANSPISIISSTGTPPSFTSAPFFPIEMTPVPEIKTEPALQYGYHFDQSSNNPWMFPAHPSYVSDPITYYNTTSCMNAANIIRTMRSDVGPELEVDLGCRTTAQDCRVPNPTVFNMMEKYSHPAIRM